MAAGSWGSGSMRWRGNGRTGTAWPQAAGGGYAKCRRWAGAVVARRNQEPQVNDSTTSSGQRKPPRAQPLQPDRPGRGDAQQTEAGDAADAEAAAKRERRAQSDTALSNVREGYK
jgi:hypothetical protein